MERVGWVLVGVFLAFCPGASAGLLPVVEATEVMLEAQGADFHVLPRIFGTDLTPVSFVSNVNAAGSSFTYSTVAGSTYLGMPLSLSGTGSETAPDFWEWSSTGVLGTDSWTTTGTAMVIGDPFLDIDWEALVEKAKKLLDKLDFKSKIELTTEDSTVTSKGTFTLTILTLPIATGTVTDSYKNGKFEWDYKVAAGQSVRPFAIHTAGFTPIEGGDGTFTTLVIPEPGTLVLTVTGVLGLVALTKLRSRWTPNRSASN